MEKDIKLKWHEVILVLLVAVSLCGIMGEIIMGKTSHANRGMELEKTIKKLFEHYEQKGIFCHKLEVAQSGGKFIKKSPFDFFIYYNKKVYAFDAKNCQSGNMSIDNFKLHQIKSLSDIESQGGDAFFLIYYAERKALNKVPVSVIVEKIKAGAKSIAYSEDRKTTLDILGVL